MTYYGGSVSWDDCNTGHSGSIFGHCAFQHFQIANFQPQTLNRGTQDPLIEEDTIIHIGDPASSFLWVCWALSV